MRGERYRDSACERAPQAACRFGQTQFFFLFFSIIFFISPYVVNLDVLHSNTQLARTRSELERLVVLYFQCSSPPFPFILNISRHRHYIKC